MFNSKNSKRSQFVKARIYLANCKPISLIYHILKFNLTSLHIDDQHNFVHLDFVFYLIILHDGWWKFDKNRPIYRWKRKTGNRVQILEQTESRLFKFILMIMVNIINFIIASYVRFCSSNDKQQMKRKKKEKLIWHYDQSLTHKKKTNWNALSIWNWNQSTVLNKFLTKKNNIYIFRSLYSFLFIFDLCSHFWLSSECLNWLFRLFNDYLYQRCSKNWVVSIYWAPLIESKLKWWWFNRMNRSTLGISDFIRSYRAHNEFFNESQFHISNV